MPLTVLLLLWPLLLCRRAVPCLPRPLAGAEAQRVRPRADAVCVEQPGEAKPQTGLTGDLAKRLMGTQAAAVTFSCCQTTQHSAAAATALA